MTQTCWRRPHSRYQHPSSLVLSVLPLLFLSFLVGSLTSSSRTISKSFLLSRIDFVDDDDDDEEEEEEDKPSSSESSDAKKSEKQQRAKRTRRRESTRSRENNTLFQSFRCDSSACNLYVLFEFFSLQLFSLSLRKNANPHIFRQNVLNPHIFALLEKTSDMYS